MIEKPGGGGGGGKPPEDGSGTRKKPGEEGNVVYPVFPRKSRRERPADQPPQPERPQEGIDDSIADTDAMIPTAEQLDHDLGAEPISPDQIPAFMPSEPNIDTRAIEGFATQHELQEHALRAAEINLQELVSQPTELVRFILTQVKEPEDLYAILAELGNQLDERDFFSLQIPRLQALTGMIAAVMAVCDAEIRTILHPEPEAQPRKGLLARLFGRSTPAAPAAPPHPHYVERCQKFKGILADLKTKVDSYLPRA